jgi:hypothetical protein
MTEKAAGMKVWADALIESFLTAGGTMPEPREDRRNSRSNRNPGADRVSCRVIRSAAEGSVLGGKRQNRVRFIVREMARHSE